MSNYLGDKVDREALYLILPIAFELARDETGNVICGPETAAACNTAIDIALEVPRYCAEIVTTAGYVGNGWDVTMANVMENHIRDQVAARDITFTIPVVSRPSNTFNTEGEIREFMEYIGDRTMRRTPKLVVVVKNWHAPRVRMIIWFLKLRAKKLGLYMPDWTIVPIPSRVPYQHRLRELFAIPENFFRIVWKNLRSRR